MYKTFDIFKAKDKYTLNFNDDRIIKYSTILKIELDTVKENMLVLFALLYEDLEEFLTTYRSINPNSSNVNRSPCCDRECVKLPSSLCNSHRIFETSIYR